MSESDRVRLLHMLDAAREVLEFCRDRNRSDLDQDRQLALALTKEIEIIGEAAARLSDQAQSAYPSIPWPQIVGMRNRLIHAYFDIDLDRVWDTVQDDLPPLIKELEQILAQESA